MDLLAVIGNYAIPFLVVLTILVFVHEYGHYWVARRCGVRVEVFSIGFGPELFGRTDRAGTRWKFSLIPLGGYVKMFGDADAASTPDESVPAMTDAEREVSFHHKPLRQRAAIVAAGPIANFLFAMLVMAGLFWTSGHPMPPPTIEDVMPGSAAERAGLEPGDTIVAIDGQRIFRFVELQIAVAGGEGAPLELEVARGDRTVTTEVTPAVTSRTGDDGEQVESYLIGVTVRSGDYGLAESLWLGVSETVNLGVATIVAVGEMIVGDRGTEELGGPIRIAEMSGVVFDIGIVMIAWFMAVLSLNLGLINLFPIPMLDGGHLVFYAIEAVRGRPLGERAQEYGFRLGLALVLSLMVFATWNDLVHLLD